jgi:hypothetical protein
LPSGWIAPPAEPALLPTDPHLAADGQAVNIIVELPAADGHKSRRGGDGENGRVETAHSIDPPLGDAASWLATRLGATNTTAPPLPPPNRMRDAGSKRTQHAPAAATAAAAASSRGHHDGAAAASNEGDGTHRRGEVVYNRLPGESSRVDPIYDELPESGQHVSDGSGGGGGGGQRTNVGAHGNGSAAVGDDGASAVYAVVDKTRKSQRAGGMASSGSGNVDPRKAAAMAGVQQAAARMAAARSGSGSSSGASGGGLASSTGSAPQPAPSLPPRRPSRDLREKESGSPQPWLVLGAGRDQLKLLTTMFAEKYVVP